MAFVKCIVEKQINSLTTVLFNNKSLKLASIFEANETVLGYSNVHLACQFSLIDNEIVSKSSWQKYFVVERTYMIDYIYIGVHYNTVKTVKMSRIM
jgi:hypothetical protein